MKLRLFCLCASFLFSFLVAEETNAVLLLNMEDKFELPRHFRASSTPFKEDAPSDVSKVGLKELNISGSGQFSELSLDYILKTINHKGNFYLVDLREEDHGFVNGNAISWFGLRDWDNAGKTLEQILESEKKHLENLSKMKEVVLATVAKKDPRGLSLPELDYLPPLKIIKVSSEEELAKKRGLIYIRLPITDQVRPEDYRIDRFIDFYKETNKGQNNWIHIHCLAGLGRTTTFMAMYDMMKNAKEVSFSDIMTRQNLIGGRDLSRPSKWFWKNKMIEERHQFLKEFYEYCKENKNGYESSWKLFLLKKKILSS